MKRSYEVYKIKVLSVFLYVLCMLSVLGISLRFYGGKEDGFEFQNAGKEVSDAGRNTGAETSHRLFAGTDADGDVEVESGAGEDDGGKGAQEEGTGAPRIALTFDDGPSSEYTERLLDGLKKRSVKASFFLIGENAKENPEIVERMYKEGHLLGNHTYHHVDITRLSREEAKKEIGETDRVVSTITGEHLAYMRPPFGVWQQDLEVEMEVMPVMWSVDPLDWTTENVSEIVNRVVTDVEENDIILLHDCYGSSVDAALQIIDILQKEGYEFVTADEILLN